MKRFKSLLLLLLVIPCVQAQVSGPTTRTPVLTVGPGLTDVQSLTVHGTCTGCGAGLVGHPFQVCVDSGGSDCGTSLPSGWTFTINGAGDYTIDTDVQGGDFSTSDWVAPAEPVAGLAPICYAVTSILSGAHGENVINLHTYTSSFVATNNVFIRGLMIGPL